jgi:tetratricopeptide (TPR) repeat protein
MMGRYDEALAETAEVTVGRSMVTYFIAPFIFSRVGRYREAEERLQRGIDQAVSLGNVERQVARELLSALLAIDKEDYSLAFEFTSHVKSLLPQVLVPTVKTRHPFAQVADLLAGTANARSGKLAAARTELESLETPDDSQSRVENWFCHTLAGEIALASADLAAAESHFSTGEPESKMLFLVKDPLYTVFIHGLPFRDGLARVKKAQGDSAGAIETYRNLNTPGMSNKWTAMLEPRYVLEVARLLDETGDKEGARAEYQRFLELWKDADPELPELEEARQYLEKEFP